MRYFLFSFFIFFIEPAHADDLRVDAEIGVCNFIGKGQGDWWKQYQGTRFDANRLTSGCKQIGISNTARVFGWRAALVDFGTTKVEESAWGGAPPNSPHWRARGELSAYGASFGGTAQKEFGSWRLRGEAGGLLYRSKIDATTTHYSRDIEFHVPLQPRTGVSPYLRGEVGYSWGRWEIGAAFQYFARVKFNNEGGGDKVGPASAAIQSNTLFIRFAL